jgi:nitronate monooxygenase
VPNQHPIIIQGGMGIAVSDWRLAHTVSSLGHLGVVSGTAIDSVLVRRLQTGDEGGHIRRALAALPIPGVGERIVARYFDDSRPDGAPFKKHPMPSAEPSRNSEDLLVASNFVEVFLAKEGHNNPVGINYLEKIQAPTLPGIYGAMLAGVDYVLMGAGIPRAIPGILDRLSEGLAVELKLDVKGTTEDHFLRFDPAVYSEGLLPPAPRPNFLAIVSSHVLATMFSRLEARVDGFIVEAPTAGGHNAPPRGKLQLSDKGEPVYGDRDEPDLAVIAELGLPFWLAGMRADPEQLRESLALGAQGIQVGTAFAFCNESGLQPDLKRQVIEMSRRGEAGVFTDPIASPTGFPFKLVEVQGTLSDGDAYTERHRICDLGYLRSAYAKEDGGVGWRCPAERVDDFVKKGGEAAELEGRKCLCNALMSNIGLGQVRPDGRQELPLLTAGDDVADVARFAPADTNSYSAADVIAYLMPGLVEA